MGRGLCHFVIAETALVADLIKRLIFEHPEIPPSCEWIRRVDRKWIYPYPIPVVITKGID